MSTEITPNEEFIKKNYDKTIELAKTVYNLEGLVPPFPPLVKLLWDLNLRYAMCPASSHKDYFSAFPGGLCYHNLNVLNLIVKFANLLAPGEYSYETLFKVVILSEIGKVGDLKNDLYLPATEDWKIKRGQYYDINQLQYMRINQRSLYFATHYGISLTEDEYLAILLADGQNEDSNSTYRYKEPKLALILQYANSWAQKIEKDLIVCL